MNLAGIIGAHPAGAAALAGEGPARSYGELRAEVAAARRALAGAGVRPGDRVALLAGNHPSSVVGVLAVLGVGAVAVPLDPAAPPSELARQVATVGATAAVTGPAGPIPGGLPVVDLAGGGPDAPEVERAASDLAVLCFTSGTVGRPRAAMLTHGNLLANLAQIQAHPGRAVRHDDVALGVLPSFHVFGLTVTVALTLSAGATLVVVPRFDPASCLEACARHRVTLLAGAPSMFSALTAAADGTPGNPLASVRLAVSGAAPLPAEVAGRFAERFGVPLHQGYGLTEASPVVTSTLVTEQPRPGSIGVPLPGVEVRLVDGDGEDALEGDPGELWVRGPNVFAGYWGDEAATTQAVTDDGWLRTGDLAVAGADGQLQLVDRVKDLVIVNGFNVVPAEVESVLAGHPDVADVAVVGIPDPRTGEAVEAVVVPREGARPSLEQLAAHAAVELAPYKCPTSLRLVGELPHGLGGKLVRRAARLHAGQEPGRRAPNL